MIDSIKSREVVDQQLERLLSLLGNEENELLAKIFFKGLASASDLLRQASNEQKQEFLSSSTGLNSFKTIDLPLIHCLRCLLARQALRFRLKSIKGLSNKNKEEKKL